VFASFVGLALGYAGVLELPAAMAALLGVLLAPTLVGLLIVATSGLTDLPERQRRRMMYAGCPPWLRRLVYGLITVMAAFPPPYTYGGFATPKGDDPGWYGLQGGVTWGPPGAGATTLKYSKLLDLGFLTPWCR
jgi:hypothetical protein